LIQWLHCFHLELDRLLHLLQLLLDKLFPLLMLMLNLVKVLVQNQKHDILLLHRLLQLKVIHLLHPLLLNNLR
jgi:hypothetical protein